MKTQLSHAFIDIDTSWKIAQTKRHIPYQLVDKAALIPLCDIAIELKEYGDLRNAIVHERIDDQPIAEPHEKWCAMEAIRDLLPRPTVGELFLGRVSPAI